MTKKRSWPGKTGWLCDDDECDYECNDAECDYDMRVILKMRNMRMTWPGMIDHDDNDGNDED